MKKRQVIVETIRLNHGMEQVIVGLNRYGFGSQLAFSIYQTYQEETLSVIQENPYQLVEDIEESDLNERTILLNKSAFRRILLFEFERRFYMKCLNTHSLRQYVCSSRCFIRRSDSTLEASRPVEISPDQVANEIITLVEHGKIQQEETKLFENSLYFSEWGIGTSIQRLLSRKKKFIMRKKKSKNIRMIEKRLNIQYGDSRSAD